MMTGIASYFFLQGFAGRFGGTIALGYAARVIISSSPRPFPPEVSLSAVSERHQTSPMAESKQVLVLSSVLASFLSVSLLDYRIRLTNCGTFAHSLGKQSVRDVRPLALFLRCVGLLGVRARLRRFPGH
jgi:hypothetical protein